MSTTLFKMFVCISLRAILMGNFRYIREKGGKFMPGAHHKPTAKTKKLVGDLMLHGLSQEDVAKRLGIAVETLVKHYYYECYELKHDINCEIENLLLEKARKGDWKAIRLWLTCRAKWAPAKTPEELEEADQRKSLIEKILGKDSVNESNGTGEGSN